MICTWCIRIGLVRILYDKIRTKEINNKIFLVRTWFVISLVRNFYRPRPSTCVKLTKFFRTEMAPKQRKNQPASLQFLQQLLQKLIEQSQPPHRLQF